MPQPTTFQLWYGREKPPLEPISLHAGPLTAQLLGRDLRNVRFGGLEVAQRIYVAVRDRNWGTVPGELSDLDVVQGDDHFAVRFTVRHCQHDIDFTWRGEILGAADGTISYAMDATAGADMTYKLIGLNVHHGMREYVGRPYQGITPRGPISGRFPVEVGPQLVADETEVPIFPDVSSLTAQLTDDVSVRFDFVGDTFEFEDQRNWTDASFKSQSYPPRRGGFLSSRVGDRVFQKVALTVSGEASSAATQPVGAMPASPGGPRGHEREASITIGAPTGTKLPPIGFGMASHGGELSPREVELLRALHPAHLRADLRLIGGGYGAELERALAACRAVGCGIELAVFVSDDAANEMLALGERLRDCDVPIRRILIFHEAEQATDARWVTLAREALAPAAAGALIAGGTDANFCELNRNRPRYTPGEGVSYAITPQIHAFDERSTDGEYRRAGGDGRYGPPLQRRRPDRRQPGHAQAALQRRRHDGGAGAGAGRAAAAGRSAPDVPLRRRVDGGERRLAGTGGSGVADLLRNNRLARVDRDGNGLARASRLPLPARRRLSPLSRLRRPRGVARRRDSRHVFRQSTDRRGAGNPDRGADASSGGQPYAARAAGAHLAACRRRSLDAPSQRGECSASDGRSARFSR